MRVAWVGVVLWLVPSWAMAQLDEPPVVDRDTFPALPDIPADVADHVAEARAFARRINRCRVNDRERTHFYNLREELLSDRCYRWWDRTETHGREVQIHAVGLEYVRNAMIEWPLPRAQQFEWLMLWALGRYHGPMRPPTERHHILQVPYLISALSAMTRDDPRHRRNAEEVINALREATLAPVTGTALVGHEAEREVTQRAAIAQAWLEWFRTVPADTTLEALRARGLEAAEPLLDSEHSAELEDAFFVRWRASNRRADWAALCRRVLASPHLLRAERHRVTERCIYSRIGYPEMRRLGRQARRARRRAEGAVRTE